MATPRTLADQCCELVDSISVSRKRDDLLEYVGGHPALEISAEKAHVAEYALACALPRKLDDECERDVVVGSFAGRASRRKLARHFLDGIEQDRVFRCDEAVRINVERARMGKHARDESALESDPIGVRSRQRRFPGAM